MTAAMAPKLYAHRVVDLAQRILSTKSLGSAILSHLLPELDFVEPSSVGPSRVMRELPSSLTMRIDLGKAQQFKPNFFGILLVLFWIRLHQGIQEKEEY
jgi:hypothetical protein